MKALFKFAAGLSLVAAAVAYLTSRRGGGLRDRLAGYARQATGLAGGTTFTRAAAGVHLSSKPADDEAIRAKIEETRRRLRDQLGAQESGRPSAKPGAGAGKEAA